MTFLGLILISLAKVIKILCNFYTFIVAASAIISWVRPDPYNPIVTFLNQATQPVYRILRRYLPKAFFASNIDFTPMIVILILVLIETVIGGALLDWGYQLRYGRL